VEDLASQTRRGPNFVVGALFLVAAADAGPLSSTGYVLAAAAVALLGALHANHTAAQGM